jgi:hypothetical protein
MKIHPVGAELINADRQTDRQTVGIHNFTKVQKTRDRDTRDQYSEIELSGKVHYSGGCLYLKYTPFKKLSLAIFMG